MTLAKAKNNVITLPIDEKKIQQYRYNALQDLENNTFRISNDVIKSLMHFDAGSFRMFEHLTKRIDLYPLQLMADENFIAAVAEGKTYIPAEYRSVTVKASEYIEDFKLNPRSGRVQFTSDACKLFEQFIPAVSLIGEDTIVGSKTRPITDIKFVSKRKEKGKSLELHELEPDDLFNPNGKLVKQASEVKLVLHETLAVAMIFVLERFTRLEGEVKKRLSIKANKLYTIMKMTMGSTMMEHGGWWELKWTLEEWNVFLSTEYASISRLKDSFKLHTELTKLSDLEVIAEADPETKVSGKYTQFYVRFRENRRLSTVLEEVKPAKPTRTLKRRPPVKAGSAAHGEWARHNLAVLIKFEKELNAIGRKLPAIDKKRMAEYQKILGIK